MFLIYYTTIYDTLFTLACNVWHTLCRPNIPKEGSYLRKAKLNILLYIVFVININFKLALPRSVNERFRNCDTAYEACMHCCA